MNTKEYISSGILELYAMGSLSPAEALDVEQKVAAFPEIAEELKQIEKSLENYALLHAKQPRPELKNRILEKIKNELKNKQQILSSSNGQPVVKTIERSNSSLTFYKYGVAAAITLILISSAINFYTWKKLQQTEQELAVLTKGKVEYDNQLELMNGSYNKALADLNILRNKDYTTVAMKGLPIAPNTLVNVYWNKQTKETYIGISELPIPPLGKQYQLWALVDGKPIDAGVFVNDTTLQKVKDIENVQTFAVTLEPEGGSTSPTLTALYAMGSI